VNVGDDVLLAGRGNSSALPNTRFVGADCVSARDIEPNSGSTEPISH